MRVKGLTCVVLGGGGFLGTNLCRRLITSGHLVRTFGHRGRFPTTVTGTDWRSGDFSDCAAVADAVEGADIVFHLIHTTVPYSASRDIASEVRDNLIPTIAFLDIVRAAGVKRVVFVSSGGTVYGRPIQIPTEENAPTEPITAYGINKLTIEKYFALYQHLYGFEYRILRVANPFGPFQIAVKKQGLIAEVISRAIQREPIEIWGDGSTIRDFIFVNDVIDALEIVAVDEGNERIFNIGSGVGRSVREVLAAVEASLATTLEIVWKDERAVDVPVSVLSVKRARDKLCWIPTTSFESGLSQTIAWWRENADLIKQVMTQVSQHGE